MKKNIDMTKKMLIIAMLTALSYAVMFVIHIPVSFLTYDPKAVIISIGGMLYGPLVSLIISIIVGLLEMITISSTGFIGAVMNIIYSAVFACTAAIFYKRKRTMANAYIGLGMGILLSTFVMIIWNLLLSPIYFGSSVDKIIKMLLPLLLPFNLIKGGINAAATALLYKPIVTSLRKANLFPKSESDTEEGGKNNKVLLWIFAVLGFALFSLALVLLKSAHTGP